MRLETTLCFHCRNFPVDLGFGMESWWGFDSEASEGKALWRELDGLIPYALRKPLDDAVIAENKTRREAEEVANRAAAKQQDAAPTGFGFEPEPAPHKSGQNP